MRNCCIRCGKVEDEKTFGFFLGTFFVQVCNNPELFKGCVK